MKTSTFISALIAMSVAAVSCNKDFETRSVPSSHDPHMPREIQFTAGGHDLELQTRAVSEITNMSGFYAMATTGTSGSESLAWSQFVGGSGIPGAVYSTGKYWPSTDPGYHFYASILEMEFGTSGATVTANGKADAICAYLETPTYNDNNHLTFEHIFGRVGNFELVMTADGYTLSGVNARISNGVKSGTYNLRTKAWSGCSAAESVPVTVGKNDYLLVPGTYTLAVTFTLTKGDYVSTFTKTATLMLDPGKITNITAKIVDDPAVQIQFTYTINAWESRNVNLTVE